HLGYAHGTLFGSRYTLDIVKPAHLFGVEKQSGYLREMIIHNQFFSMLNYAGIKSKNIIIAKRIIVGQRDQIAVKGKRVNFLHKKQDFGQAKKRAADNDRYPAFYFLGHRLNNTAFFIE